MLFNGFLTVLNVAVVLGFNYITERKIHKDLSYTIIQYFSSNVHCTKHKLKIQV